MRMLQRRPVIGSSDTASRWAGYRRKGWAVVMTILLLTVALLLTPSHGNRNAPASSSECVILLHGLCRSSFSMAFVKHRLKQSGFYVVSIDYASMTKTIAEIADEDLSAVVRQCMNQGFSRIHIVTHSLGGIVARCYLQHRQLPPGSRIVMLAPPNQGSELIDWAQHHFPRLSRLAGPSGNQLHTTSALLAPKLKPFEPEVGIITGNDSWNPIFSQLLPGEDDGKVTVQSAKLEGMQDFFVAPCNHTTILLNRIVLHQIEHFLQTGYFARD